eukprot:TRINITY_DN4285_c0_g1_i1.p1 TRINITY_DN4285_c0_g1~~TRINITY_DN4285_c0_g1_i1.p1  ORF type:complete len:429 (+),score=99.51 TRINITY_DN4285_c0_g1_i1:165-1451(+)
MSMLSISPSTLNNLINFSTLQTALIEIVKALQNQDASISQIKTEMSYFTEQISQLKNDMAHLENIIQQRPSRTEVEKMVDSLKNLNVGKMRQIEEALAMKTDLLSKLELLGMKVSDLEGKSSTPVSNNNSSLDLFKFNEEMRKINVLLSQKVDFEKLREVDMKVGRLDSQFPPIQNQIKDILSKLPKGSSSTENNNTTISTEEFEKLKKRLAEYESQISQYASKTELEKNVSLLSDLGLKKLEKSEFDQFLKDMNDFKDKLEEHNQYITRLKTAVRDMNDTIVSHVDTHSEGGPMYMDEEGTAGGRVHYRCLICDKVNFRIAGTTIDGKYIPGLPPGRRTLLVGSDNHTYYGREDQSPPLSPTTAPNSGFATERSSTKNTARSTTGSPLSNSISDETALHWENSRNMPRKSSTSQYRPTSAGSALSRK